MSVAKKQGRQELIGTLCRQAGELIQESFAKTEEWKRGVSRFPEIELRLIYLVAAFVERYFPGDRLFGKDDSADFAGNVWVCDPVDGSYFFTHNLPLYSFSVALLTDGVPVVAAVYIPTTDTLYYAEKGAGATLNGQPLSQFSTPSLGGRIIMLTSPDILDLGAIYNELRAEGCKPLISYSVIQHAAMVASGEMAAVINGRDSLQDMPAAQLIIEEAGGIVTDLAGKRHDFSKPKLDGFLAADPQIHSQLVRLIAAHRA